MDKLTLTSPILELLAEAGKKGRKWEIVILEAGKSLNNRFYPKELLLKERAKFEGAKVNLYQIGEEFGHLPSRVRNQIPEGFPKTIVGWITNVRFSKIAEGREGLIGTVTITESQEWLASLLYDAWQEGVKDLLGFSIDAYGSGEVKEVDGEKVYYVNAIDHVNEVTVVQNPAAGGKLMRLVAALEKEEAGKETPMFKEFRESVIKFLVKAEPKLLDKISLTESTNDMVVAACMDLIQAWTGRPELVAALTKLIAAVKADAGIKESLDELAKIHENAKQSPNEGLKTEKGESEMDPKEIQALKESNENISKQLTAMAETARKSLLHSKLLESKLPDATQEKIRTEFAGKEFGEVEIDAKIKLEREYAAKLVEGRNPGGITRVEVGANGKDNFTEALEATLAMTGTVKGKDGKDVLGFTSLHEAYYRFTKNDPTIEPFSSSFKDRLWRDVRGGMALRAMDKGGTLTEAITVSSFGEILGDSITRRMIAEYKEVGLDDWKKVVTIAPPVKDFRTQRVDRLGGYGTNMPTVAEAGAYTALTSPTDEEATFAVTKKGGLESITMEAVKNDDLRALRKIPMRLGRGAKNTLYQFVFDFFRTNPTIYDTVALFHATHANLGVTALSQDQVNAAQIALNDQAGYNEANFFIQPQIKYMIVPNELELLGWQIAKSTVQVGPSNFNNTVPNYFEKFNIDVIKVPYFTDSNNWYASADPNLIPTIEIGFLEGNEEPEILQELSGSGDDFTNDRMRLKLRHIYGAAVVDYRGLWGAVVP